MRSRGDERSIRVLLVADWRLCRSLRGRLGEGVSVVEAGGLHEALWCLRHAAFDAVITEQRMLDGTGSALLATVRKTDPKCRRALMSSAIFTSEEADPPHEAFFVKSGELALSLRAWLDGLAQEGA